MNKELNNKLVSAVVRAKRPRNNRNPGTTQSLPGEVARFFGDLPVRDSKNSIWVQPSLADINDAIPGHPCKCVIARYLKRTYRSALVYIFRTIAYVQLLDERGNKIVYRFSLSPQARNYVAQYDRRKTALPGGFELSAPASGKKLSYYTKYRKTRKKAEAEGTFKLRLKKKTTTKGQKIKGYRMEYDVRSGRSLVQFPTTKAA